MNQDNMRKRSEADYARFNLSKNKWRVESE